MDDITAENWLPIPDWVGFYEVSDLGNLRSVDRIVENNGQRTGRGGWQTRRLRGRPIKSTPDSQGRYRLVQLKRDNGHKHYLVHRLVLEAFVGPCPEGMESCHANDIHDDNRLTNLRWDTPSANNLDIVANGNHHNANKTHCPHGHEYTSANTYVMSRAHGFTFRVCRTCDNARNRAQYRARRQRDIDKKVSAA